MITISVVVPVYNVEHYLDKCMASLLAQSYTDYELILVDDGSTDQSGILCDRYAEQYEHVRVIHQQNKGLGGARNTGIENAKGDYLLFIDSDDFIHPDLLKRCADHAQHYDCDMVLFDHIAVFDNGSRGAVYPCSVKAGEPLTKADLASLVFLSGACNRLFRRALFTDTGIRFPEKVWYEDLRTVSKLMPAVKTAFYDAVEPLYFYLQRSGSIMHTPDFSRIVNERIAAVAEITKYYQDKGLFDAYREELEFLWLFHGFFLPVREMQAVSTRFAKYADQLLSRLLEEFPNAGQNRYIAEQLDNKERFLLKCALKKCYITIKIFSFANKVLKRIRHVQ